MHSMVPSPRPCKERKDEKISLQSIKFLCRLLYLGTGGYRSLTNHVERA
jgi:hypothetical protein